MPIFRRYLRVYHGCTWCPPHYYYYYSVANPSRCFSLCLLTSSLYLISLLSPFPSSFILFRFLTHSLSLSLSSYLGCLALLVWLSFFRSLLKKRIYYIIFIFLPYAYCMWLSLFVSLLFVFYLLFFPLLNPFLVTMSFAGYFHARFLLSAFFPVCLFCFVFL